MRNLTPRGLILNLGRGQWAAFDTDPLRVAACGTGAGSHRARSHRVAYEPDRKTPGGQSPAPEPDGRTFAANGIYPGWQAGARPSFDDPREPAPTAEEAAAGRSANSPGASAIRIVRDGVVLEYLAGGASVREWMTADAAGSGAIRQFEIGAATATLRLLLGSKAPAATLALCAGTSAAVSLESIPAEPSPVWAVKIAPHAAPLEFCAAISGGPSTVDAEVAPDTR